jgi:hypothetical protein
MRRRDVKGNILILVSSLVILVVSIAFWFYNSDIINDEYSKLTVMTGKETYDIKDKQKLSEIINSINESPRKYYKKTDFGFDYTENVLLIFKKYNNEEEVLIFLPKLGYVVTDYWIINTGLLLH